MGHTLTVGLSDLSRELGENTVNQTTNRIGHYNDAVVEFANDRKWPFLCKENTTKTTSDIASNILDISSITDMRYPGGVKELTVGDSTDPILPINWDDRGIHAGENKFCHRPDETSLLFLHDQDANQTIHLWHYYIPARITDPASASQFPIPDRYRKTVAVLAAAFVQWSRYLEAQGNRLYNFYQKLRDNVGTQQSEQPSHKPLTMKHYLQHVGLRRTYNGR